ncbi:MAG: hypothetical protein INQ03_20265 [Candidatus Heimdallarchaeota archaeon]|nr:hypothetical protein [Candidatus Heimdallarchaeota archaeon]
MNLAVSSLTPFVPNYSEYDQININNISTSVFISRWMTSSISEGSSNANQIKLPLVTTGT